MTKRRVLVVSADILPYPSLPTTGAGLRAWSLGQGLISRGHEVIFSMPAAACAGRNVSPDILRLAWQPQQLHKIISTVAPEVVVVCGWSTMNHLLEPIHVPIALDQHGPLLLERQFRQAGTAEANQREKWRGLSQADYFCCAGHKQRAYFEPWLKQAGFEANSSLTGVIPVSLSPDLPAHTFAAELTFVYGGVFLPWQDPTAGLEAVIGQMEARQRGQLKFFGGKHPFIKMEEDIFKTVLQRLEQSFRVAVQPMTAHAELIETYRQAHVALDIMAHNAERELAFTTRTVEYLWCGLPVMYHDYAELSELLRRYDAGWVVSPQDKAAIQAALTEIFEQPNVIIRKSANAQRLVRECLNWELTIEPLDQFIQQPTMRANKPTLPTKNLSHLLDNAYQHYQYGGLLHLLKMGREFVQKQLGIRN